MDLNTLAIIKKYVDKKVINGLSGKSAYQIAVDNGFEGTEQEWLSSLNAEDKMDKAQEVISSDNLSQGQVYYTSNEDIALGVKTLNGEKQAPTKEYVDDKLGDKASAIDVDLPDESYNTNIKDLSKSSDKITIKIKENSALNYSNVIVSDGENLLPEFFTSVAPVGETNGLTIEFLNNNSMRLNGTCTESFNIFFKFKTNRISLTKQIKPNDSIIMGCLSSGSISVQNSYLSYAFKDSEEGDLFTESLYFNTSNNNIVSKKIISTDNIPKTQIIFRAIKDATYTNFTITPFLFLGDNLTFLENLTYTNGYYNTEITGYDYLFTYPNKHLLTYKIDTKTYIDDNNLFIISTNDTTDRTEDISLALQKGSCMLGPGVFYVTGVELPINTMIKGSGNSTQVIWKNTSTSENYIFKLNSRCSLSDMMILGTDANNYTGVQNIGNLSGVLVEGVFDGENTTQGPSQCTLSNLFIAKIAGSGITLRKTGTNIRQHTQIINCNIINSDCGILNDIYSEFNMYTNTACNGNYYGVITRGGNNRFTNCDFSANNVGIYVDNSTDQSPNHGHGCFVGCEVAHAQPNNTGYLIICDGIEYGENFLGGLFAYGNILISNSTSIKFHNANFGAGTITVENSTGTIFNGVTFRQSDSTVSVDANSTNTNFVNCFYGDGTPFTT